MVKLFLLKQKYVDKWMLLTLITQNQIEHASNKEYRLHCQRPVLNLSKLSCPHLYNKGYKTYYGGLLWSLSSKWKVYNIVLAIWSCLLLLLSIFKGKTAAHKLALVTKSL
jgi:hypothetical protein